MAAANGLIDAAGATHNPCVLSFAFFAYGFAFRDADPVRALDACRRGLVIARDSGNRTSETHLAGVVCRRHRDDAIVRVVQRHLGVDVGVRYCRLWACGRLKVLHAFVFRLARVRRHIAECGHSRKHWSRRAAPGFARRRGSELPPQRHRGLAQRGGVGFCSAIASRSAPQKVGPPRRRVKRAY
jgi:hypothetical protein